MKTHVYGVPSAESSARPQPPPAGPAGSTGVYIGGLQWWTTDAELDALCRAYGELSGLRFFEDKANGKSKGYALADFASAETALRCKEGLNGCGPISGATPVLFLCGAARALERAEAALGMSVAVLQGRLERGRGNLWSCKVRCGAASQGGLLDACLTGGGPVPHARAALKGCVCAGRQLINGKKCVVTFAGAPVATGRGRVCLRLPCMPCLAALPPC